VQIRAYVPFVPVDDVVVVAGLQELLEEEFVDVDVAGNTPKL
jgi:hypothetical protein